MKILEILNGVWAIEPNKLIEIREIYDTHLRGEKIDVEAVEMRLGKPLKNEPQGYEVVKGVAIIPIEGVMGKKMNLFSQISGGASTELAARDFKKALADPSVFSILLYIDSPGGAVDGAFELVELIYSSRGEKPVTAFTDGVMASAAYAVGAAADKVIISGDTTRVGSIGVRTLHLDTSKKEEKAGKKYTEITAGKYKAVGSQHSPLSLFDKASIQERLDYIYGVFVREVAKSRNVSVEKVLKDMADGRIFIGKQAITAGLVDGVSTFDQLVSDMAAGDAAAGSGDLSETRVNQFSKEVLTMPEDKKTDEPTIKIEQITADFIKKRYPYIASHFQKIGAEAEIKRIQDVEAQCVPGHEEIIKKLKFDGKTTGGEAAIQILAAEKEKKAAVLQEIKDDAPDVLESVDSGEEGTEAEEIEKTARAMAGDTIKEDK